MKSDFITSQNKTVLKGSNSIQCYGSMIRNFIPAEINCADSLETFKSKIRMWVVPLQNLKNYISNFRLLGTF